MDFRNYWGEWKSSKAFVLLKKYVTSLTNTRDIGRIVDFALGTFQSPAGYRRRRSYIASRA